MYRAIAYVVADSIKRENRHILFKSLERAVFVDRRVVFLRVVGRLHLGTVPARGHPVLHVCNLLSFLKAQLAVGLPRDAQLTDAFALFHKMRAIF